MISTPAVFIFAGMLHFCILIASFAVPQVLDWRRELQKVPRLLGQLIWVHGAYVVLMIVGFGLLSATNASELATGSVLARSVCAFIAVFWGGRLALQFAYFKPGPYLRGPLLKVGYHSLTGIFALLTVIYGWGALR